MKIVAYFQELNWTLNFKFTFSTPFFNSAVKSSLNALLYFEKYSYFMCVFSSSLHKLQVILISNKNYQKNHGNISKYLEGL